MKMEILSVTVFVSNGTDTIMIETSLPRATFPFDGTQTLKMEAARGTAVQYVKDNFGIEPKVINAE